MHVAIIMAIRSIESPNIGNVTRCIGLNYNACDLITFGALTVALT